MTARKLPLQSLVTFRNSQGEGARGTLLKLGRSTVVFEVYNPYSIVQLSEVLQEFIIRRGDRVIYHGRAIVTNLVNTGLMLIVSAKVLDAWSGLSMILRESDDAELRIEVEFFINEWEAASRLRAGFVLSVNLLRSFLEELNRWLAELDLEFPYTDDNTASVDSIAGRLGEIFIPKLKKLFESFEREAGAVPAEDLDNHKACAQRDLHPLLLSSPFVHRTFAKPLGFAGDYEMMNMIQRNPVQGQTMYSRLLNMLFLSAAIPESVRNRTAVLCSVLESEAKRLHAAGRCFRVLNVGCGPAIEVRRFLELLDSSSACSFTLLDFNQETLRFVEDEFRRLDSPGAKNAELTFVHESVHNLLKANAALQPPDDLFDVVYCSGLFDYLSDRICSRLLRLFYASVAPGGMIFVTNMHKRNPDRHVMDFLMEWYLIYRDEDDMGHLAPRLGTQRVYCDDTGVNVGLEIRKL